jgi:GAF domain-containing protein
MMRLLDWLRSLGRLNYHYTDPYEELRARGLLRLSLGIAVAALLYLPFLLFGQYLPLVIGIFAFLSLLAIVGLYGVIELVHHGQVVTASLAFIIVIFVGVVAAFVTSPSPSNLIAFSLPIVAAGALLNRRGMIVMVGLVLIALLSTAIFNSLGIFTSFAAADLSPTSNMIFSALVLLLNALIMAVFIGGQRLLQRRNLALTRELRSSSAISQALAGIQTLDALLDQAVTLIRDQLNYYHVRIFLFEEKTNLLVMRAGTTFSAQTGASLRRIAPDENTILNEVIRDGQTLTLTTNSPASRRSEMLSGMVAQLLIPMRRDDKVMGILDVQNTTLDRLIPQDIEVLESIAAQIGQSVHNIRLYDTLQDTTRERLRLAEQLRQAGREIEQLNQEVTGRAWTTYMEGRADKVVGYDWKDGNAYQNTDISPRLERAIASTMPELHQDGSEQLLSVPIIWRGQALGAMEFRAPAGRLWTDRSIELAHVVSQRLALALDNIRLFEQAQILASREQTANQIATTLQANTDLDALVTVAAEAFQKALGASRTSIRLGLPAEKVGQNGSHSS